MNIQYERIQQACSHLKLDSIASEWSAIADKAIKEERTLADFLERVLSLEVEAKSERTQATLFKFSGLPSLKRFEDYDFKFATGAPK